MLKRHFLVRLAAGVGLVLGAALASSAALAQAKAPDVLIKELSADVLAAVKADKAIIAGDVSRILALVDAKVMPHLDFEKMTEGAVGHHWKKATPEQRQRLQQEFKTLLVRSYSGALAQVKETTTIDVKPLRARPEDPRVLVRTEVRGNGQPIQLDYRLEKQGDGWKIYDINVLGAWLVLTYQSSFAQEINAGGIDGLIAKLVERNKAAAGKG